MFKGETVHFDVPAEVAPGQRFVVQLPAPSDLHPAGADTAPEDSEAGKKKGFFSAISEEVNRIDDDATVTAIHEGAEKFGAKTEESFKYVQIFTAICDSWSHGANDIANSVGPFAAIYSIWMSGRVVSKNELGSEIYWILTLGAIGIDVGLLVYGHKIIKAIGTKLAKITPSRGFAIELSSAVIIIIGSRLGIPLSTTHCQVGHSHALTPVRSQPTIPAGGRHARCRFVGVRRQRQEERQEESRRVSVPRHQLQGAAQNLRGLGRHPDRGRHAVGAPHRTGGVRPGENGHQQQLHGQRLPQRLPRAGRVHIRPKRHPTVIWL